MKFQMTCVKLKSNGKKVHDLQARVLSRVKGITGPPDHALKEYSEGLKKKNGNSKRKPGKKEKDVLAELSFPRVLRRKNCGVRSRLRLTMCWQIDRVGPITLHAERRSYFWNNEVDLNTRQ
jgi:hypothetical protein